MKTAEPVQSRSIRSWKFRASAIAAAAALLVLGGGELASATPPVHSRTTVAIASPTSGSAITGTFEVAITGAHLRSVKLFAGLGFVGSATVSSDGASATAEVDGAKLREGTTILTAVATGVGSGPSAHAVSRPVVLKVKNIGADAHPAGYRLVFADEFGGTKLDRSVWCTRYMYDGGPALQVPDASCLHTNPGNGITYGNLDTLGNNGQEQEVYRDTNVDGMTMHTEQNGYVALHATATRPGDPKNLDYESAMLRSKAQFQPTANHPLYLTARMRLPDVLGTWPAFWLAGGYGPDDRLPNWPPEIDILESPLNTHASGVDGGQGANTMHVGTITYGCDGTCPQNQGDFTNVAPGFDTEWGNYVAPSTTRGVWVEVGLSWYTDHICWVFDGTTVACQPYTWVANEGPDATNTAPLLFDLAVGGPWAGSGGIEDAKFPTEFDIDHVRVYRK